MDQNRLSRAGEILAIFGLFAVVNGHGIVLRSGMIYYI